MRKIIQVCMIPDSRLADLWITQALCDDGSLWIMSDAKRTWFPLPPIPQDAAMTPQQGG